MIQITKNLVMIADDYCYTVGIPRQRADRGLVLDHPTYYATAAQAVQGALNRAMRQTVADGSITTLREFIQEQERQRAELEKLIVPLDSAGTPCRNAEKAGPAAEAGKDTPNA